MADQHPIPLSLYIHFPWCIQKCPYCDFNSHGVKATGIPEQAYMAALLKDIKNDMALIYDRPIQSIFFGGGTPSLISGAAMQGLLDQLNDILVFKPDIEITLEANPGTVDAGHFSAYRKAGVNRLSIGVQSLRDRQLKNLGRIHSAQEAIKAYKTAKLAGFENINLDLMFALPEDDVEGCLYDLDQLIGLAPQHISWYQLTMEPNTAFYRQPPALPSDDQIWSQQQAGLRSLAEAGYVQYEISAYSRAGYRSEHNLNYWRFGDYLGIGAGAHSKISSADLALIERFSKPRSPKQYLQDPTHHVEPKCLNSADRILEFMMNNLRLKQGFSQQDFESRTGLDFSQLLPTFEQAADQGLVEFKSTQEIATTEKGSQFLNDLLALFTAD